MITPVVNRYGKEFSSAVVEQARQEYEALIPQIPFIGGAKNRWTANLIEAVQILALYRAMQAQGKPLSETAGLLREAMQIRLAQYPRLALRLLGRLQFSRLFLNGLQRQAHETHKRAYPENFVADIVRGDGDEKCNSRLKQGRETAISS